MLDVRYSSRFKKDVRLCTKRGCKMELLRQAIDILRGLRISAASVLRSCIKWKLDGL